MQIPHSCPSKLCVTLWITMFTSGQTRKNRGFAKGAREMTNPGTFWQLAHSTPAVPANRAPVPPLLRKVHAPRRLSRLVQRQRLHLLGLPLVAAVAGLAACSKSEEPAAKAPATDSGLPPAQVYEKVATTGKGFTVGALMSANPVFVLFDPQCPHCGHLWGTSQPLLNKVKFVWVPVSFINGKSAPQGAAILGAPNPAEFMAAHEASLLAGTGGAPLSGSTPPELEAVIKTNTELFNSLKAESVPYIVAKNVKTGTIVTHAGAMETAALAELLGV